MYLTHSEIQRLNLLKKRSPSDRFLLMSQLINYQFEAMKAGLKYKNPNFDEKNIFTETLEWVCNKLDLVNIPHMITGGSDLGFWGHIKTTMDIDLKYIKKWIKRLSIEDAFSKLQ